ncbi:MAG: response regulator transcription factor [Deltaproteobacteria bacterium]|nr:response regulator transcription factor [Deltaproteobacteria bacterium]
MKPCILVVDDDPQFVGMLRHGLHGPWTMQIESTMHGALAWIESGQSFSAAIVDVHLPDGSGLRIVEAVRARAALRPVIVMTGDHSAFLVNRVWALRSEYLLKTDLPEVLAMLRQRFLDVAATHRQEIVGYLDKYSGGKGLSPRELEVLTMAVLDSDRDEICEVLDISMETLKTHVKNILLKCGHARFDDLARKLRIKARSRISAAMTRL